MKSTVIEGECYVCCEVGDVRTDLCACTDRPLHVSCQRRLLASTSNDGKCTVCRTHFRNATLLTDRRENPQWWVLQLVLGASYAALAICGALLLVHATNMSQIQSHPRCRRIPIASAKNNSTIVIYESTCAALEFFPMVGDTAVATTILLACCVCGVVCLVVKRIINARPRVLVNREWRTT